MTIYDWGLQAVGTPLPPQWYGLHREGLEVAAAENLLALWGALGLQRERNSDASKHLPQFAFR